MSKHKQEPVVGLSEMGVGLDEVIRRGARRVIEQAIDAELAELLERFGNVRTLQGQRAVVRNGYLPEREVLTAAGPVPVKVPKVRDGPCRNFVCKAYHDEPEYVCRTRRRRQPRPQRSCRAFPRN